MNRQERVQNLGGGIRQLIAGSDGILYALKENGDLLWYRHTTFQTGYGGKGSWLGPKKVAAGWDIFGMCFGGGQGVLYGVTDDGQLFWYFHKGFKDGSGDWSSPYRPVGHGWRFSQIFAAADGNIFGLKSDGEVLWYKHQGWKPTDTQKTRDIWQGPVSAGTGLGGYQHVFALMPSEVVGPR